MPSKLPPTTQSVHFVGSICLPNSTTVFRRLSDQLGNHLIKLRPLEYDDAAISSYQEFRRLKEEGVIPAGVRFQPEYQATVEPIYEAAMIKVIEHIQEHIPARELAIQFDAPSEFAYLEGLATNSIHWFSPLLDGLVERMVRLAAKVNPLVEFGLHLCYGDFGHKHFVEPKDTRLLTDFVNLLLSAIPRQIDWIHMPVPKGRTDAAYFAPLKELRLGGTELYLGLIHKDDEEGTRTRIEVAKEAVPEFGISTECGLGRADLDELESVLDIAATSLMSVSS